MSELCQGIPALCPVVWETGKGMASSPQVFLGKLDFTWADEGVNPSRSACIRKRPQSSKEQEAGPVHSISMGGPFFPLLAQAFRRLWSVCVYFHVCVNINHKKVKCLNQRAVCLEYCCFLFPYVYSLELSQVSTTSKVFCVSNSYSRSSLSNTAATYGYLV
jgi:hypothetical protein